ncbi:hypothetical protein F2P81_009934 [Scophthalmus maximus]|uniref:Uncharacterized protein n=1 Tax=Scophthalmus maximus TaxID=52904 RepID=A0A6A4SZ09_SCOMX|nr:hypothetical protein F2P81_009934 [Scophthalmus maximus]
MMRQTVREKRLHLVNHNFKPGPLVVSTLHSLRSTVMDYAAKSFDRVDKYNLTEQTRLTKKIHEDANKDECNTVTAFNDQEQEREREREEREEREDDER